MSLERVATASQTPVLQEPVHVDVGPAVDSATPPCGVPRLLPLPPLMRRVPSASRSSTGALSHILMRRRTFRSTIRRAAH